MILPLLATEPGWLGSALLVGLMTLIAMVGPVIVRRRISFEQLRINNEVAGFKFATVGVLYAVLMAFAIIIVWEKFSEAENAVAQEAGALATLYRLSDGIGGELGATLHRSLDRYVQTAIADDWPAMEHGKASRSVKQALDGTYAALLAFEPSDGRGGSLLSEALHQLDVVTQARRVRLVLAPGVVPRMLWLMLSGGALATIGFTLFFGAENLRVQVAMTGILSFLIFSGLLVITAIDHPFAGAVRVMPESLAALLDDFNGAKSTSQGTLGGR